MDRRIAEEADRQWQVGVAAATEDHQLADHEPAEGKPIQVTDSVQVGVEKESAESRDDDGDDDGKDESYNFVEVADRGKAGLDGGKDDELVELMGIPNADQRNSPDCGMDNPGVNLKRQIVTNKTIIRLIDYSTTIDKCLNLKKQNDQVYLEVDHKETKPTMMKRLVA